MEDGQGAWQEHLDPQSGNVFWFNSITKASVWEKPAELKTRAEINCPWKAYISDSGRKFYFNQQTKESVWVEPPELKAVREGLDRDGKQKTESTGALPTFVPPPTEAKKVAYTAFDSVPKEEITYRTQEERVEAFRSLLQQAGVTSTWNWEMTMRAIINDEKYKAIPQLSEKKKILQDFQAEKRKQEREEKKKKESKLREQFMQMLKENASHITKRMNWKKAFPYFESDPRYAAIPDRDREDLFLQYLDQVEREEQAQFRQQKRENREKFREKLQNDPTVDINTQWRTVKEAYKDDPTFLQLDPIDRLNVFEEYYKDLDKADEEKRRTESQARGKDSRKNREAFRNLLNESQEQGLITAQTRWSNFQRTIRDNPIYKAMIDPKQTGSLPAELFSDLLDKLEEAYQEDKKKLKAIIAELKFDLTSKTSPDELRSAVSSHGKFGEISEKHQQPLFEDLIKKAEKKEKQIAKDTERAHKKNISRFVDMLENMRNLTSFSKWEEIRPVIQDENAFLKLNDEDERIRIFNEISSKRKEDSSDEEGIIREKSPVSTAPPPPKKEDGDDRDHDRDRDRDRKSKKDKKHKKEKKDKKRKKQRDNSPERREKKSRSEHRDSSSHRDRDREYRDRDREHRDDRDRMDKDDLYRRRKQVEYSSGEEGERKE
eukprot:TRINITY_DN5032_c0_g1_i1.p1 TRINITY_DN5032_c0_g1~~TRINITY_DN5032_c0_g1_i1.p1  ORF type:complete len:660 (-),score=249.63 TRINITY_DN5032_c0_g1_i1:234-2213(-)